MEHQINRRKLLKAAGAAGGLALVGNAQAVTTDYGPVRLVEVSVVYNLPERDDYRRTNIDGNPGYFVDSNRERIVLTPPLSDDTERVFEANNQVVGSRGINSVPANVTGSNSVRAIITEVRQRRRPTESVQIVKPHQPPRVKIHHDQNGELALLAEEHTETLEPGTEETYQLSTQTVTARTARHTDETADVDGIPEYRLGPKTEYDEVEVGAVPIVSVKDHGELPVVRIQNA